MRSSPATFPMVIPAEAGTHFDFSRKSKMGPRFRGDDEIMDYESVRR
jgi:hypothetical protein